MKKVLILLTFPLFIKTAYLYSVKLFFLYVFYHYNIKKIKFISTSIEQLKQSLINRINSNNENYILNLPTHYITTGALKPDKTNGLASLTFSYQ